MHLTFDGVNDAFKAIVEGIHGGTIKTRRSSSRNGAVIVAEEPVTVTYRYPTRRVLFNAARDANPFALLYEAMWTLAGRNDVDPLAYYTRRMREFSDDGSTWYGAYGHRWRHHKLDFVDTEYDQLDRAVELLKENLDSRRVVLTMWNPTLDLIDQRPEGKDYPCNTHAYLAVRDGKLDLTVCNRSNDLCWGMLGANYVTFSVLLEYMAARLGAEVGTYHHMSNNLHAYDDPGNPNVAPWRPAEWLKEYAEPDDDPRRYEDLTTVPLVKDPEAFERELPEFVERAHRFNLFEDEMDVVWSEPFLEGVADPMVRAYRAHKNKGATALLHCNQIKADDWRVACRSWLERRLNRA